MSSWRSSRLVAWMSAPSSSCTRNSCRAGQGTGRPAAVVRSRRNARSQRSYSRALAGRIVGDFRWHGISYRTGLADGRRSRSLEAAPAVRSCRGAGVARWSPVLTSLAAVAVALLGGAIVIALSGTIQSRPTGAVEGAFGSRRAIAETLAASTPSSSAAWLSPWPTGPGCSISVSKARWSWADWPLGSSLPDLGLPAVIYFRWRRGRARFAGGIWGSIAGILKAMTGAHEVITTIMLNYLAFRILSFVLLETEDVLPVNPSFRPQTWRPRKQDCRSFSATPDCMLGCSLASPLRS